MKTSSVQQRKVAGRPQTSEKEIEFVRVAYKRRPSEPIRRAFTQLQILHFLTRNLKKFEEYTKENSYLVSNCNAAGKHFLLFFLKITL